MKTGVIMLPFAAANLIRTLPPLEVSEEQRGRLWQQLQASLGAGPVPAQSTPSRAIPPSTARFALPATSLRRTEARRMATFVLLFVSGVAVGLLLALLKPVRSPPGPGPDGPAVVSGCAPVETAPLMPGTSPPLLAPSAPPLLAPSAPPLLAPLPTAAPAAVPPGRGALSKQDEAHLLWIARQALLESPPNAERALNALAARAHRFGTSTPLQNEAAALQREAEAALAAPPGTAPEQSSRHGANLK